MPIFHQSHHHVNNLVLSPNFSTILFFFQWFFFDLVYSPTAKAKLKFNHGHGVSKFREFSRWPRVSRWSVADAANCATGRIHYRAAGTQVAETIKQGMGGSSNDWLHGADSMSTALSVYRSPAAVLPISAVLFYRIARSSLVKRKTRIVWRIVQKFFPLCLSFSGNINLWRSFETNCKLTHRAWLYD